MQRKAVLLGPGKGRVSSGRAHNGVPSALAALFVDDVRQTLIVESVLLAFFVIPIDRNTGAARKDVVQAESDMVEGIGHSLQLLLRRQAIFSQSTESFWPRSCW